MQTLMQLKAFGMGEGTYLSELIGWGGEGGEGEAGMLLERAVKWRSPVSQTTLGSCLNRAVLKWND